MSQNYDNAQNLLYSKLKKKKKMAEMLSSSFLELKQLSALMQNNS